MPRASPLYDKNTISMSNLGPSTRTQVELFIRQYLDEYADKYDLDITDSEWRVNLITNSQNEYTGSAYVYFRDSRLYHLFLGNNADGSRKISRIMNPYYDSKNSERCKSLPGIDLHLLPYIEVPRTREIPLPIIELEENQLVENNFNKFVQPDIGPCVLRESDFYSNVLICERAPTFMTASNFYDLFSFYIKDEDDRKQYPIVELIDRGRSYSVEVTFPPNKIDALFAEIMTKKVKVLYKSERLYVLSFRLKILSPRE